MCKGRVRHYVALAAMVAAVVLACCSSAYGLDPSLDVSQYAHTSWKVRDGFTKGEINAIAQTPDGYLWLGTAFGLFRFDGVRAVPWQPPSGEQLAGNYISSLLAARDGTLWVGTQTGLASWKQGKVTTYPSMAGQHIYTLLEDREGAIWAGGIRSPNLARLCAFRKTGTECHGGDGSLGSGVTGFYEDSKGSLWVGVIGGFWRWRPGPPEYFPVAADRNGVRGFAEDAQGTLLVGVRAAGIGRFVNGRVAIEPLPGHLSRVEKQPLGIMKMLRDRDGGLWIGAVDHGLIHLHDGKADTFSQADGLSANFILDIVEDREGDVWIATVGGLDRFRPYIVPTITQKQGLPTDTVASVLSASDGSVWAPTLAGLSRWSQGKISIFGSKPDGNLNGAAPNSIFEDGSGRIWISTVRDFGYLNDGRYVPVSGYAGGTVNGIVEQPAGQLWLANQRQGLLHIVQGKIVQHFPWAALGHTQHADALARDTNKGGLWLGFFTEGGIAYFADGAIQKTYSAADGLGAGSVNHLQFGSDGALWAATDGGLSRIKDGHIATLTSKNGLPCDSVHWTIEDNDHQMWLYMPCGLVRVAQSDLQAWAANPAETVRTTVFDALDGVRTHAFAYGYRPQVTKSPDGKLWFVPGDGLSVIDPHHLPSNKLPPPVQVEQITADGKIYDASNGLALPAHVRYLTIDYTALSLAVPERVHFRFKLEGQDPDWREVVNVRQVQYSNLPPGKFHFRVVACNNSGVWNETGANLNFSIAPAYYQTTWFRALCVAAFAGLLWTLYQLRLHQIQRQFAAGLEGRVGERMRIARELHDTLLQSFQGATFQIQAARKLLLRKADNAMEVLDASILASEEAIQEGRSAIRDLRPEPATQRSLPELLNAAGRELAIAHELNGPAPGYRTIVEGRLQDLSPMLQDEIYRISREVIRNAFTHAAATQIEVEIHYDKDQLRLRIRDDGKGIDPSTLEAGGQSGHWGIPGIRERAQRIGSRLDFWSEMGAGTEVQLTVPAAMVYENRRGGRRFRFFRRAGSVEPRS